MAVAKNPGVGRGKGGGRPKREGKAGFMVELPEETLSILKARASAVKLPVWRVLDEIILAALVGQLTPEPPPALPAEAPLDLPSAAMELAQEAADFLACCEASPKAVKALRWAWKNALAFAERELERPAGAP